MERLPFEKYDKVIVAFSGGKDSTACVLDLLQRGVPKEKIELWHHKIDGAANAFMDWPSTPDYCRQFAEEFGLALRFSWRQGGFLTEMLRAGTPTAPVTFETPHGVDTYGGQGRRHTRLTAQNA